jgi:hypothetical protein
MSNLDGQNKEIGLILAKDHKRWIFTPFEPLMNKFKALRRQSYKWLSQMNLGSFQKINEVLSLISLALEVFVILFFLWSSCPHNVSHCDLFRMTNTFYQSCDCKGINQYSQMKTLSCLLFTSLAPRQRKYKSRRRQKTKQKRLSSGIDKLLHVNAFSA